MVNKAKYLGRRRSDNVENDALHSQEEGLGSRESPSTMDKFRRRDIHTSDTQRHELTSEHAEDKPLRPDTSKSSPKGHEKH